MLAELRSGLWKAGPEYIAMSLARLQGHYWRPDFTPSQAEELYVDFMDDLGHLPPDILDAAITKYRRDPESKWFPKPSQLLAIAEPLLAERRRAVARIERASTPDDRPAPPKRTPEELARIDELVRTVARPMNGESE